MATPGQTQPRLVAPYVPFKSFLTALDNLRHGPPVILDRSVWPTFSGGLAGQMLAAFRFLGFINEDYEVTDILNRAIDPDQRKEVLAKVIRTSFSEVVDLDLTRATPKQLADVLSEQYNVIGSTHKKAMTFFLHAARFVDLPLSPAISRKTRNSVPRRRRNGSSAKEGGELISGQGEHAEQELPTTKGSSRTIKLKGGGSATLAFDVDVWSMTPEDQQFVFDMIKRMTDYEQANRVAVD